MQPHICVFGGSNPSRKDGYSIGRVHKKFGRTCKVCGSTPHRSIPLSRLPAACHCLPRNFLIPGKRAGAPVRLLPGCRGYRREKRGNSRWEERRRSLIGRLLVGRLSVADGRPRPSCPSLRTSAQPAFRIRPDEEGIRVWKKNCL